MKFLQDLLEEAEVGIGLLIFTHYGVLNCRLYSATCCLFCQSLLLNGRALS